jgi:cytochrome c oxidase subunit 2
MTVTVFFTLLIILLVVYFAVKFRRRSETERPKAIHGSLALEIAWTGVPFVIAMAMFVWGSSLFVAMARPPEDAIEVFVVGKQWMWKIQHPDGQREINELHVPVGQPVKLTMTSEDVIHAFFVPSFRVKADVVPGRYSTAWFTATKPGTYHLFCAEYCGTSHSKMIGSIVVMQPAEFQGWLEAHAEGSLALEGRKMFLELQCVTCHSATAQARAPALEEIYRRPVQLKDGRTVTADESYLRESILSPGSKDVAGFEYIMPTFKELFDEKGQPKEEDLLKLIAFIKSLKAGQTPTRVEQAESPPRAAESPKGQEP